MGNIDTTVSFSGNRPSKLPGGGDESADEILELKNELSKEISRSYSEGFTQFLVGMAEGFDLFAASAVIEFKRTHPDVQLCAVVPFQDDRLHSDEYNAVLNAADDVQIMSQTFNKGAYLQRNEYLVDNSSKLICYYDGINGGTEYTVDYALKKGKMVVNLAPKEEKGPILTCFSA